MTSTAKPTAFGIKALTSWCLLRILFVLHLDFFYLISSIDILSVHTSTPIHSPYEDTNSYSNASKSNNLVLTYLSTYLSISISIHKQFTF